jgi:hypothetical protein
VPGRAFHIETQDKVQPGISLPLSSAFLVEINHIDSRIFSQHSLVHQSGQAAIHSYGLISTQSAVAEDEHRSQRLCRAAKRLANDAHDFVGQHHRIYRFTVVVRFNLDLGAKAEAGSLRILHSPLQSVASLGATPLPNNRIRPLAKLSTGWARRPTHFQFIAHGILYSPAQAAENGHWKTWESCLRHVSGE